MNTQCSHFLLQCKGSHELTLLRKPVESKEETVWPWFHCRACIFSSLRANTGSSFPFWTKCTAVASLDSLQIWGWGHQLTGYSCHLFFFSCRRLLIPVHNWDRKGTRFTYVTDLYALINCVTFYTQQKRRVCFVPAIRNPILAMWYNFCWCSRRWRKCEPSPCLVQESRL